MNELAVKMAKIKRVLIIIPIILVILLGINFGYIKRFNEIKHAVNGPDATQEVYFETGDREDTTGGWIKRDFELNGELVDLNAQTIDGYFYNNSKYVTSEWKVTIYIEGDCYLNSAWCGVVEIHQHVGTADEKVQTLDLRNYNIDDVILDNVYDGDILIPLSKGDYIVYIPSEEEHEYPAGAGKTIGIGFIFYYMDYPNLSNTRLEYYYKRTYTDFWVFHLAATLTAIWVFLGGIYGTSHYMYRNAMRELELRKAGVSSMSDIYAIIYIIDLGEDYLVPVSADEESEKLRPKDMKASEQLSNMFKFDAIDAYLDTMLEFSDLSTLPERLQNKNTIACEYISKSYGWCRIRFFAMQRDEEGQITHVVFTIQVIEEEKAEMEAISERVDAAELESKAKSTFLANMSHEIRTPINTVLGLDTMILRECKDKTIRAYARDIKSAANMLLSLINGILDFSKLEAGKMDLVPADYSLKRVLSDVRNMVRSRVEAKHLELIFDVAPDLPDKLYGDDVRLRQILINLLTNAAKYTEEGSVKVSVYGKPHDDFVHLLFSVKDTGMGIKEEDKKKLAQRFSRFDEKKNRTVEGTGIGLNLVTGLLDLMGSELQVISNYGEGSEFYFEIEQKVLSDEKIGKINFDEIVDEDEDEYAPSFISKGACILVVDDNVLNLTVIENLLKETKLEIDTADSGRQALKKCSEKKYDLVFMDHMMPEMDGVETFKILRKEEGLNKETPVIVLTANALKGAEEEYKQIGFTDFLPKPVQPELLEEKIAKYVDSSKIEVNTKKVAKKAEKVELPTIDGIDVAYGLEHTGGLESLMKILDQFVTMADSNEAELRGYFDAIMANESDESAIDSYRIKVHSMKSSAGVMGGLQVSGMAAILENAARNKNIAEIKDVTPHFFAEWKRLKDNIKGYFGAGAKEEKATIDVKMLEELLHQLNTSMSAYDIKASDEIIKKLDSFGFDEEKSKLVDELKTAVVNLDADKVTELCSELMK